jgi:hypothetical protein
MATPGATSWALFPAGYEAVLPHLYDVPIDQFVLDFANRDMVDVAALKSLPPDKEVAVGVIDVRTSMVRLRKSWPTASGRSSPWSHPSASTSPRTAG